MADGNRRTGRTATCSCGRDLEEIDLYGTPFFTRLLRRDCLTWWHVDGTATHQGRPA